VVVLTVLVMELMLMEVRLAETVLVPVLLVVMVVVVPVRRCAMLVLPASPGVVKVRVNGLDVVLVVLAGMVVVVL